MEQFLDISALQEELNPSVFSLDSLRGLLLLLLIIGIVVCLVRRMTRLVGLGIVVLILIQILHVFSTSTIGSNIPVLADIFKYDVFQSLAQLFVGTPVCTGFLYVQQFFNQTFGLAFEAVYYIWKIVQPWLKHLYDTFSNFGQL